MLYDLNIAWSPTDSAAELEQTLKFSASLGYNVVAINHTLSHPIPFQVVNPIPVLGRPSPHHPKRAPKSDNPPSTSTTASQRDDTLPVALRRATVIMADPATNHRLPAVAAAYDLVAVRPTTEKAFAAACLLSGAEAGLISLDLTTSFPFHFRPRPCMAAVRRGLRFELCYGEALLDTAAVALDARRRAAFVGNVMALVRATRGRGLVVSSGARSALGLRAPADVVNLLAVWGLGTERGTEAIGVNPRAVVVNEGMRRRAFRGVVDVISGAVEGGAARPTNSEKGRGKGDGTADNKGGQDAATKTGKRKAGTMGDAADEAQQPPLSKRQAKKLRAAARSKAAVQGVP